MNASGGVVPGRTEAHLTSTARPHVRSRSAAVKASGGSYGEPSDAHMSTPFLPMTVEELRHVLPGVLCWWGVWTREWWAVISTSAGYRLVNANTVQDLARTIAKALAQ